MVKIRQQAIDDAGANNQIKTSYRLLSIGQAEIKASLS